MAGSVPVKRGMQNMEWIHFIHNSWWGDVIFSTNDVILHDAQETSFDADKCLLVNVHINLEKCDFYMQVCAFG